MGRYGVREALQPFGSFLQIIHLLRRHLASAFIFTLYLASVASRSLRYVLSVARKCWLLYYTKCVCAKERLNSFGTRET